MRALSRNTRRATAVTLAAALVIAVYLNWQYARSDVPTELPDNAAMVAAEAEDVPVQAQTVLDELPTEAEAVSSANKNYGEAQLVSVASDSGAKFFEQARLKRQKAHDEAMTLIGLCRIELVAQHIVEVGDERRVFKPTLMRCHLVHGIVLPQSVVTTECLETGLYGHAGAGQKNDVLHTCCLLL